MLTLEDKLIEMPINDLYRLWNTDKEYLVVLIHVFNVGAAYETICTNNYDKYSNVSDDGYSFILENESETHYTIEAMLLKQLDRITSAWTKYCYDYNFTEFLSKYHITNFKYNQLLKLQRHSQVNY